MESQFEAITVNLLNQVAAADSGGVSIIDLATHSGPVVTGVLLLLIFFSIACWAIIILKFRQIYNAASVSALFLDSFWKAARLDGIYDNSDSFVKSPVCQVFRAGYVELGRVLKSRKADSSGNQGMWGALGGVETIERSMKRSALDQLTSLEALVPFLATIGSTAPFIGLFGTVWGIMKSFHEIGKMGSASLAVVAPGISEALIATAAGLAAAIPAVIAYNYFISRIKVLENEMDNFSSDFLNIVERHFFRTDESRRAPSIVPQPTLPKE